MPKLYLFSQKFDRLNYSYKGAYSTKVRALQYGSKILQLTDQAKTCSKTQRNKGTQEKYCYLKETIISLRLKKI